MGAYRLDGRVALVTGASRRQGIGAAVARELARGGADVFLSYFAAYDDTTTWGPDPEGPAETLAAIRTDGVRAAALELDLTVAGAPERLLAAAREQLGPVSILVNNAAVSEPGGIDDLTGAQLDRHYALNVRAMALLCAALARQLPPGQSGRIINLTSGQDVAPMPQELAYATSKGAVVAFTTSLSAALGPRGITVNAVDPGPTDTGWMTPEVAVALAAQAPLGRVGYPQDAARLIRFLASDEAGWITGQIIHARGGL
jgi:3-oxoacyl-[acyl-carrier protein] reductase